LFKSTPNSRTKVQLFGVIIYESTLLFCGSFKATARADMEIDQHSVGSGSAKSKDLVAALDKISSLHSWTQENLPTSTPPIVSQAALIAAVQTVKGSPISLKALISSIGCSEAGLRRPLQRLLDEGWAVIVTDKNDQRVRRVVATGKLLEALIQFADLIADRETQAESA